MSMNHHFSSSDLPQNLWWKTHHMMEPSSNSPHISLPFLHHPLPTTTTTFNFNANDQESSCVQDKDEFPNEPMFEKPLTPSDVGKLNRLVIPKQHAEKYFPLDADSVEKGLLLGFEDELGKSWRFRYSYWNSSQSYVLTKGWSRFVKEKRLDAGDVVLFGRHRVDGERFFIGWRRRGVIVPTDGRGLVTQGGGNSEWTRVFSNAQAYPVHSGGSGGGGVGNGPSFQYQPDCLHAEENVNNNNKRATTTSGNRRRWVRLFGVNLESGPDDYEPATPPGASSSSSVSNQSQGGQDHYFFNSNHQHQPHMDLNLCRDVNKVRYQYQQQQ